MIKPKRLIFLFLIVSACQSQGNLSIIGDVTNTLREVSAAEFTEQSGLIWTIEDSGNDNRLYGLNFKGKIVESIRINNASNIDWEDLTSDEVGNLYIGDFGNNNKKRSIFTIYKIKKENLKSKAINAEIITFSLPLSLKPKDFEGFLLIKNNFYLFSKETKTMSVFRVPNSTGNHQATLVSEYNFKGKNNRITAADYNPTTKEIILLNHNKLWKLSNYKNDTFFSGNIDKYPFKHNSQKEGLCFKNDSIVLITDERNGTTGGNLYLFNLNRTKKDPE